MLLLLKRFCRSWRLFWRASSLGRPLPQIPSSTLRSFSFSVSSSSPLHLSLPAPMAPPISRTCSASLRTSLPSHSKRLFISLLLGNPRQRPRRSTQPFKAFKDVFAATSRRSTRLWTA
ncbi:hypothetical protein BOTBODRAFT_275809 [Botryobasidium botryosum FD-172 SS1]|uniref:Uncharacterized protein n=1 Tax=Botryobasidium botryosum (strain FD-172 SS1) TaxID=930990 RepID=A0A067MVM9_BOTB1|nr:hypothetical protein BOTBODRAFT_275809 [Botryobasidium botryosum FD-172 SS1]